MVARDAVIVLLVLSERCAQCVSQGGDGVLTCLSVRGFARIVCCVHVQRSLMSSTDLLPSFA